MKKYLSAVVLSGFLLTACDKTEIPEASNMDLLTQAPWVYQDAGFDNNSDGTIDFSLSATLQECVMDNKLTFTPGSGTMDEGATRCNTTDPPLVPFTWSFADNETAINFSGNSLFGLTGKFKILELSETKFRMSKDTVFFGTAAAIVVNLKH